MWKKFYSGVEMSLQSFDQYGKNSHYLQLNGLKSRVMNYEVIRGFAPISILEEISDPSKYQRDIIPDHAEAIKKYVEHGTARFFPEIILGFNKNLLDSSHSEDIKIFTSDKGISSSFLHFDKKTKNVKIQFKLGPDGKIPKELKMAISRIDGNHRLNRAAEFAHEDVEEYIVSFCLIILREDQQKGNEELIFHTINNKAISLIDEENLKVIIKNESTFSNEELKKNEIVLYLTRLIGKDSYPTLSPIFENFGNKKLTNLSVISKIILKSTPCPLDLTKNDSEIRTTFLLLLGKINTIYDSVEQRDKIAKLRYIIPLITYIHLNIGQQDAKKTKWWTKKFVDWIEMNDLFELEDVNCLKIWKIFIKVFESKTNQIFISMQFDKDGKDLFAAINRAIIATGNEQGRKLETIRIDEHRKGVTFTIDEEILKKIRDGGLLIGDISTNNANVFHEIGYMMGLSHQRGIEGQVILLCNEEKIKTSGGDVKFNLQHQKQLRYSSYAQLELELKAELKAYYEQYKIESIPH